MHLKMLYKNIDAFLLSDSFLGDKDPSKIRPYDQWIYIAAYHAYTVDELKGPAKFKFGYTTKLKERGAAHEAGKEPTSFTASIVYAWPIPNAKQFETEIKRFFKHFIYKDAFQYLNLQMRTVDTRTEIIWGLKLFTIVKLFRLIILKCALQFGFVGNALDETGSFDNFMLPPDCIVDDEERYANYLGATRKVYVDKLILEAQYRIKYKLLNTCNAQHNEGYVEITEDAFYNYVLGNTWKYKRNDWILKNKPYSFKPHTNLLGLSIKDIVDITIKWKGEDQKAEIKAFGEGPLLGAYIVRWIKTEEPLAYYTEDWIVAPDEVETIDLVL